MTPPKHGDIRVCFLPEIPDHAIVIDAPDLTSARLVHDALTAVLSSELEHFRYRAHADIVLQRFTEEEGWDDIDPSEYVEGQEI